MSVRFILGRSGTGKTRCCINAIIAALRHKTPTNLMLLVPEQATYQAERAILSDSSITGYNRLNVLSFDRLAYLLTKNNSARPALSKMAQEMIILKILRQHRHQFRALRPAAISTGMAKKMAQTIAEMQQCDKTEQDIQTLLTRLQKHQPNTWTEAIQRLLNQDAVAATDQVYHTRLC